MPQNPLDLKLYDKLYRYCNYRERSTSEVLKKLRSLDPLVHPEPFLKELVDDGLLDDARFAKNYAQGKSRIKGWGKQKIKAHLSKLGVDKRWVEEALTELDEDSYQEVLSQLALRKLESTKGENDYERKAKVFRYLRQKGYETDDVHRVLFSNS